MKLTFLRGAMFAALLGWGGCSLSLVGCAPRTEYVTFTGFAQGTTYSIIVRDPAPDTESKIDSVFQEIDFTFSMFNSESLVSRINRNETDRTSKLFEECFLVAKQVHADTEGFYDPTVKPLIDAWGFGPEEMQREPNVDSLMEFVGFDKISLVDGGNGETTGRIVKADRRVQLDFSSIAKGFTVDKMAEMLARTSGKRAGRQNSGASRKKTATAHDFLVEIGGEIRVSGVNRQGRAWRVQIDAPEGGFAHHQAAVISLGRNADSERANASRCKKILGSEAGETPATTPRFPLTSVATSGNYRNNFTVEAGDVRVHTVDPHTGEMAAGEILSASIVAQSCAEADGWATALVAARELSTAESWLLAKAFGRLEWYVIREEGTLHSPEFPLSR